MQKPESQFNMIDWWRKVVMENYANFTGRARRAEYWYFVLLNSIGLAALAIPVSFLSYISLEITRILMLLLLLFWLGTAIPGLAVTVRRLHDTNKSGWYYLFCLIPFIGSIIILVWMFTDGDRFANNYGPDPKGPEIPQFDFEQTPGQFQR